LLWASRSPTLGIPVADDYGLLDQIEFHPPLDWLGPFGSPYYWRPIGRQLYFLLLAPTMVERPGVSVVVHGCLLMTLAVALYSAARRRFTPPVAAALASFPLLAEPSRILFAWPTCENLSATVCVAVAANETLAGRRLTAGIAALASVLCHESATIGLLLLPVLGWWRTKRLTDLAAWGAIAAAVAAIEVAGTRRGSHSRNEHADRRRRWIAAIHSAGLCCPGWSPSRWLRSSTSRIFLGRSPDGSCSDIWACWRSLWSWPCVASDAGG
jgi:hypothetical protein